MILADRTDHLFVAVQFDCSGVGVMEKVREQRLKNEMNGIVKLIQLKIKIERPELFSGDAENYHSIGSPLAKRVISLGYFRKMHSLYRQFEKELRYNLPTFDFFCKQRVFWLRRRGKRNLLEKLTDRELVRRGLPPFYGQVKRAGGGR